MATKQELRKKIKRLREKIAQIEDQHNFKVRGYRAEIGDLEEENDCLLTENCCIEDEIWTALEDRLGAKIVAEIQLDIKCRR